jgi:hypothetical protein
MTVGDCPTCAGPPCDGGSDHNLDGEIAPCCECCPVASRAEVERLRGALGEVAIHGWVEGTEGARACERCRVWSSAREYVHAADCPVRIARDALGHVQAHSAREPQP